MNLDQFDKLALCARQEQPPGVDVAAQVAAKVAARLRSSATVAGRGGGISDAWGVDNRWLAVCTAAALMVAVVISTWTSPPSAEVDDPWQGLVEPVVVLQ